LARLFLCVRAGLKYFKPDCCNIINFRRVDFLILRKRVEFIEHLDNGQILDAVKFVAETKTCCFVETPDRRLCSVGIQQKFIAGTEAVQSVEYIQIL